MHMRVGAAANVYQQSGLHPCWKPNRAIPARLPTVNSTLMPFANVTGNNRGGPPPYHAGRPAQTPPGRNSEFLDSYLALGSKEGWAHQNRPDIRLRLGSLK